METATEEKQKDGSESATTETIPTAPPPAPDTTKRSRKEDRAKKDDKSIEQFMKGLNSVPLEEKVTLLCQKYVQIAEDNKKMQFYIKQSDKRYALTAKEKDQLQLEHNKSILIKSKLENLCRELQKQNKAIKEESLLKIKEEEERRKETQAKFQNTLTEITALLQQNNEKNTQLRDDNISMNEKFKSVVQQYQLREQQVEKMAKQMALESELSDAKLQKASLEHQAEKERLLTEMEHIKVTMAQYRAKIAELQGTEDNLRSQVAIYTDKYNEFQSALVKSNQFYGGFKDQMEMMSKKIKKLEKESLTWKQRCETMQTALLDMYGERQTAVDRANNIARQLAHMQGLCRTLQAERTVLLDTLKENNIERPPLPPPQAPPTPPPVVSPESNAKVDAMAANCAQLRQSLAHLQGQLNVLTNKQTNTPVPEPKPEKPKKSKSKKKNKQKNTEKDVQENKDSPAIDDQKVEFNDADEVNDGTEINDVVDSKDETLETLIQAINSANINLCDLEVGEEGILNGVSDVNDVRQDFDDKVAKVEDKNDDKKVEVNDGANSSTNKVVKDVSNVNSSSASNDEVSHIVEVKPILNEV